MTDYSFFDGSEPLITFNTRDPHEVIFVGLVDGDQESRAALLVLLENPADPHNSLVRGYLMQTEALHEAIHIDVLTRMKAVEALRDDNAKPIMNIKNGGAIMTIDGQLIGMATAQIKRNPHCMFVQIDPGCIAIEGPQHIDRGGPGFGGLDF